MSHSLAMLMLFMCCPLVFFFSTDFLKSLAFGKPKNSDTNHIVAVIIIKEFYNVALSILQMNGKYV